MFFEVISAAQKSKEKHYFLWKLVPQYLNAEKNIKIVVNSQIRSVIKPQSSSLLMYTGLRMFSHPSGLRKNPIIFITVYTLYPQPFYMIFVDPLVILVGHHTVVVKENPYYIYNSVHTCTNEILISDVNSDKNSLTIIYMCLKMYCLKICC